MLGIGGLCALKVLQTDVFSSIMIMDMCDENMP